MKARSALVFANTRSGWKTAHHLFLESVNMAMDHQGMINEQIRVPPKNTLYVLNSHDPKEWDFVCVAGGDGTVSTVATQMYSRPGWREKPILIVPGGMQSSIPKALGLYTSQDSLAALTAYNVKQIPVWNVTISDTGSKVVPPQVEGEGDFDNGSGSKDYDNVSVAAGEGLMCWSGVGIGTFADVIRDSRRMQLWTTQMMSLPQLKHRHLWVSLYHIMMKRTVVYCKVVMDTVVPDPQGGQAMVPGPQVAIDAPLYMCQMSRVKLQQARFTLTPKATYSVDCAQVTIAKASADRARMLHLFTRESGAQEIQEEDGVETHLVSRIAVTAVDRPFDLLVDGEAYCCGEGLTLTLERGQGSMGFFVGPDSTL